MPRVLHFWYAWRNQLEPLADAGYHVVAPVDRDGTSRDHDHRRDADDGRLGDQDSTVVPAMADGLDRWITDVEVHHLPDASHWVQEDRPGRVTDLLLEFL